MSAPYVETPPSRLQRLAFDPLKRIVSPSRWAAWNRRYWILRHHLDDRRENRRWQTAPARIVVASEPHEMRHMYSWFLDWLTRERPEMRRMIRVARIPCTLPPETSLFHAWVQDPVIERDRRLFAQLSATERECADRGITVIHPAAVLSHSRREVLCDRLNRVGLRTPRIVLVDATFGETRGGFSLPMIVRKPWGHGAEIRRLDSDAAFRAWWSHARSEPEAWVAGEYLDVRDSDGYYRKYRCVMAGARGVPRHLIVSPDWEVRPSTRIKTPATKAEELSFVESAFTHFDRFDAARRALDFEIAAFDYSYDADRQLIVWEVNPYPDLSTPHGEVGRYLTPAIHRSYAMLADFYQERARM